MNNSTQINVDKVFAAFVDCALWSTNADHLDPEGTGAAGSLQDIGAELSDEARASMREDVESFLSDPSLAGALDFWATEHGEEAIGHDFSLTRDGHGAGFWDRWSGGTRGHEHGRLLTEASKPYGEVGLYVGDDGKVYS
jgi:hypothetical protein